MEGFWLIDNQLMAMHKWEEGIKNDNRTLEMATIWVQVWNLPLHWVCKEVGRKIGQMFQEVKDVLIPLNES